MLASRLWKHLHAACALAVIAGFNPFVHVWLGIKLLGVALYILLAWIAFRHARSANARILFFALALLVFAWVVSMARTKSAWGFLML